LSRCRAARKAAEAERAIIIVRLTFVRYVALAALVVWLGVLANALGPLLEIDALRHVHLVSAVCGGVILLALLAMKFIGPPPRAFVPRAAIVVAMLAAMGSTLFWRAGSLAAIGTATVCGFGLLMWYARE